GSCGRWRGHTARMVGRNRTRTPCPRDRMSLDGRLDRELRTIVVSGNGNPQRLSRGIAAASHVDGLMQGAFVNSRQVDAHLLIERYGDFLLTGAVRPGPGVPVVPREGFRPAVYRDRKHGFVIPLITASISRERLF